MWRESVRTEKIMEAYTGFAYVYDEYMDNIPYDEWSEYLIELLKENGIEKGQCIAELGCGTGTVTRILDSNGYDCIGIDLSEDMISVLDFQSEEIKQIAIDKSFIFHHRDEIKSSGFVIHSLNAALWAFYSTDNFKDAVLKATNLADDSDTVAAICGMIAGAYYGLDGIPKEWVKKLHRQEEIKKLAANLIYPKD